MRTTSRAPRETKPAPAPCTARATHNREVEVTKGRVVSWDRGFDAEGNHIWGAEKGGYEFVKSD